MYLMSKVATPPNSVRVRCGPSIHVCQSDSWQCPWSFAHPSHQLIVCYSAIPDADSRVRPIRQTWLRSTCTPPLFFYLFVFSFHFIFINFSDFSCLLIAVIAFLLLSTLWGVSSAWALMSGADIHSPLFLFVYGLWPMWVWGHSVFNESLLLSSRSWFVPLSHDVHGLGTPTWALWVKCPWRISITPIGGVSLAEITIYLLQKEARLAICRHLSY